jgi:undecaprenyl-diphosphatase
VELIKAVVYGIVQGLTEFLPISSTAHLRIVPSFLGWEDPGAAYTAVIQLGTLLAVLIYFRQDLALALKGWVGSFKGGEAAKTREAKLGWAVFFGTIPIVVAGLVFKHEIKSETFRSLHVIAWALIGMGLLLLLADRLARKKRPMEKATVRDGIIVGLWQAIALIPGSSRSGSTITGALFAGFDRAAAARFSFLLSVPSVFAAGVLELLEERKEILEQNLTSTIIATLVSFVVGYWAIGFLIRFLQKRSAAIFVAYRIALGLLLLFLLQSGRLKPDQGIPPDKQTPASVQNR